MTKQYCVKRALAALGCCAALTSTVWAQLAPPSQDLQEIVVTAEKRESTVQKTPFSITAISGSDLQAERLSDFTSLAQQLPCISFSTSPHASRDVSVALTGVRGRGAPAAGRAGQISGWLDGWEGGESVPG